MEPETVNVLATGVVALTLIGVRIEASRMQVLRETDDMGDKLDNIGTTSTKNLNMHKHPDDSGFGTKETNAMLGRVLVRMDDQRKTDDLLRESIRIQKELVMVIRHSLKESGHPAPIMIPGGD